MLIRLRITNVERDYLVSKSANKLFFRQMLTTVRFTRLNPRKKSVTTVAALCLS